MRHLDAVFSPAAARCYRRLPLILLPEESVSFLDYDPHLLAAGPESLSLPFDDFLLGFPFGVTKALPGHTARGRLWIRARRLASVEADDPATIISSDDLEAIAMPDDWLLLEVWEEKASGRLPPSPDCSLVPLVREGYQDAHRYWHIYSNPACRQQLLGSWCNVAGCVRTDFVRSTCQVAELFRGLQCRLLVFSLLYLAVGNIFGKSDRVR
ncbi:MAG: hypothetical protein JXO49_05125 [Deltaproteobacteria bacterium]|nr:hypothetical protein [Candidatus Anaeroferrophillus wilburensis]MBN2888709.1 hypothetical protein [Deltaproteobacteria bacterium]